MVNIEHFNKGWLGGKESLKISSPYGMRIHPVSKERKMHWGIDISVPDGTPIYPPVKGVWGGSQIQMGIDGKSTGAGLYGWMICEDDNGEKYQIIFMHLSELNPFLMKGSKLNPEWDNGESISLIGYTGGRPGHKWAGSSTGPHLHLEIHINVGDGFSYTGSAGHAINPIDFLDDVLIDVKGNPINVNPNSNNKPPESDKPTEIVKSSEIDNAATEWENKKKYEYDEKYVNGIWQIVKVLIDSSVENKQVYDSSISTMTGSLINFFNKVCQRPMVEFFGDTIGSQYYFFVRRPPFDSVGFRKSKIGYEIGMNEVIRYSMTKNNNNIYSWYQFIPQAELLVSPQLQQYVPAVFFKEYAELWGSKPLVVQSNYYNYAYSGKNNKDGGSSNEIIKNALLDFKYIIECNAYNPFIFNASVTLVGIKRIKRGTFVKFNNKKFYVEAVSHRVDFQGNMTTELSLSHGMEIDYVEEKTLPNGDKISYFNIIDFDDFDKKIENVKFNDWNNILMNWKVNYDTFGFFLRLVENVSYFRNEKDLWE